MVATYQILFKQKIASSFNSELITELQTSEWLTNDSISKIESKRLFAHPFFTSFLDTQNSSSACDLEFSKSDYLYNVCKHINEKRLLTDSTTVKTLDTTKISYSPFPQHLFHDRRHSPFASLTLIILILAIPFLALSRPRSTSFVPVVVSKAIMLSPVRFI